MNTEKQFKGVILQKKFNFLRFFKAIVEIPYMTWIWFLDRKLNKKNLLVKEILFETPQVMSFVFSIQWKHELSLIFSIICNWLGRTSSDQWEV